jgi:transposase
MYNGITLVDGLTHRWLTDALVKIYNDHAKVHLPGFSPRNIRRYMPANNPSAPRRIRTSRPKNSMTETNVGTFLVRLKIVRQILITKLERKDVVRVEYLPKGSSDYNAVEECWRQGKDDLLVAKYYPKFFNLKNAIANYYRTRRFKLDITKYLFRKDS